MPLEYKSFAGFEDILPVLDEYVVWHGNLVQSCLEGKPSTEEAPAIFLQWIVKALADKNLTGAEATKVRAIHKDMIAAAQAFTAKCKNPEKMPLKEYAEFTRHYQEFIRCMRHFESDMAIENSGFDESTGLRSVKFLQYDISVEMERLARQGHPFSLALVKINNFKDEWREREEDCRIMIRRIAEEIKACLRSFDDAYYLGDEYFLLAMKHTDVLGSQAGMNRLNQGVIAAHILSPDDGDPEISISTVLSEPSIGDTLETLLANMKKDLLGIESRGTILQYNDMSPIQRYMHSLGKDS